MIVDRGQVAAALPGYELGAKLGAGAFGLVLAARHRRLNRPVAVKVLAVAEGAVADFAAEARVLAALDHPHVVRVHDYVEAEDLHLIVMELLGGGTLTRRVAGMPVEGACAVGLAVAAALRCAHAAGVLHRDVKPGNVLFDAAGLLKVTDFGIAKIVEGSAATASGVIGTPAYMAPEQILGGRLGPATDVYALGVVLYQLLTGAAPFDPKLPVRMLWQHHLDTTPAPPAGVAAPVAEVVLRALAKDPAARPADAQAFALDLARAAADAYGPRWTARSGIVVRLDDDVREAVAEHADRVARQATQRAAEQQAREAAAAHAEALRTAHRERDEAARLAADTERELARVRQAADAREAEFSRLTAEWDSEREQTQQKITRLQGELTSLRQSAGRTPAASPAPPPTPGPRRALAVRTAVSVTLTLAVVACTVLLVRAWSGGTATNARVLSPEPLGTPLEGDTDYVSSVAFSPDGHTLAIGGFDGTVRLWDVTDPAVVSRPLGNPLPSHTAVQSVAFSPDGRTLASSGDLTLRLWDVADPAHSHPLGQPLQGHTDLVESVAFAPDGRTLASGSDDGTVRLWDVADPAHPHPLGEPLTGHDLYVSSVMFSPDGDTLASGGGSDTVRLWDVADPAHPHPLAMLSTNAVAPVDSMAFSPDGHTLASGGGGVDGKVWLWDVSDPAHPHQLGPSLEGHTSNVLSMVFAPDGRTLVTGGGAEEGGKVWLWDVADPAHPHQLGDPLRDHTDAVWTVAFSPDGRTLASGSDDRTVRLWAVR